MIALPSIAFGGFSGSAKGVTARYTDGRSVLSLKSYPTGAATAVQVARRASLSRISKSWRNLTDGQMAAWESLSEHFTGASSLGTKAELSGFNLYVRLNSNRVMAGNSILVNAPSISSLPEVSYSEIWITPSTLVIKDIVSQDSPLKLVVKMSAPQSSGVSSGWSKTVIVSPGLSDDWGDADMTTLYFSTIGIYPTVGQKVFVEMYWLDTETGMTGVSALDSRICQSEEDAAAAGYVRRHLYTLADIDADNSHVSALNVETSTGGVAMAVDAMCLGHSNVASSEVVINEALTAYKGCTMFALGRSANSSHINAQSYIVYISVSSGTTKLTFAHRGGYYAKPTEVFGPAIVYK